MGFCKYHILPLPHGAPQYATWDAQALAKRYGFPTLDAPRYDLLVAVISLGGGYKHSDLEAYCAKLGIPVPPVTDLSVDGATNQPGSDADTENCLDIQVIAGATGGKIGILFVSAPNSEAGFANAIMEASRNQKVVSISISWGAPERDWPSTAMTNMNTAFSDALDNKIPSFAASGDDGSADGAPGQNVDFPASSPDCIGVGGTLIKDNAEIGWAYGGGGPSANFERPLFQTHSTAKMRGVPDVAANADPSSGYKIVVNGQWGVVGGTSGAAPMLAAWHALIVAKSGKRLGADFIRRIYADWKMSDVLQGSNGAYQAGPDYDYVTGAGVPNAEATAALIGSDVPVPVPTPDPTNPCLTLCQSVRMFLKVFNQTRHAMENGTMANVNFTPQEQQALASAGQTICQNLPKLLQTILGGCPTTPAPNAAGTCAGLLQALPVLLQVLGLFCPTQPPTP